MTWPLVGGCLAAVSLLVLVVLAVRARTHPPRGVHSIEVAACAALLLFGLGLRVRAVEALYSGQLTADEAWLSRIYVASIVAGEPNTHGATYLVHAWLLEGWYRLVGFSVAAPRWLNVVLGALGLPCFFAAGRALLGGRTALWATAFLAICTYAIYFSKFALEPVHVLFFLPLEGWLLARWLRRPSAASAVLLGGTVAAGCFTYGGMLVALIALAVGMTLAGVIEWVRGRAAPGGWPAWWSWAVVLASFTGVMAAGVLLHARVYSQYFRDRGGFVWSHAGYVDALRTFLFDLLTTFGGPHFGYGDGYADTLRIYLADVFVTTRTFNCPYHVAFLEVTWWPFALLGIVTVWNRDPRPITRGIILSIPIALVLLPFLGVVPGMRRGIYLLLPFCLLAGAGVAWIVGRVHPLWSALLLALAVVHPVGYQLLTAPRAASWSQYDFGAHPIPDQVLRQHLASHDVVLSAVEFQHGWDRRRHVAFRDLAIRYGLLDRTAGAVHVLGPRGAALAKLVQRAPGTVLLTWEPEKRARELIDRGSVCFRNAIESPHPASPWTLRFVSRALAAVDDTCPDARR